MMTTTARRRIPGLSLSAGLAFMGCIALASPVGAVTIDLVNGNTGTANNTIYNINASEGTLDLFLAIQADGMEQGYNEGVAAQNAWDTVSPTRDVLFRSSLPWISAACPTLNSSSPSIRPTAARV